MPSRSPDVSMHAANTSRKMGGTGRGGEKKTSVWEHLDNRKKAVQGKRIKKIPLNQ